MKQLLRSVPVLRVPRVRSLTPTFQEWFWEARTRILLGYILLLVGLILAALPLVYHRVLAQVDARVLESIAEELEAFERFRSEMGSEMQSERLTASAQSNVSPLETKPAVTQPTVTQSAVTKLAVTQSAITAPRLKPSGITPQNSEKLKSLMDAFLEYRIPEDDTFLIAVVDGEFYQSSPRGLPKPLQPGQPILRQLKRIRVPKSGEIPGTNELGKLLYTVEPVQVGDASDRGEADRSLGALLIVHATWGEREEALSALYEVAQVLISLMVLALALGWWISGRVLAPLRSLGLTAQRVSEANLSQRIPVQGKGELANLAQTFNDMMARLENAFETQRHLLNDVGHELRTPITIIRGHLELLEGDPQEIEETRELLLDELDRMGRLINELILLAKSERPDFLHGETFNLSVFMADLFAKAQALGDRIWQLESLGDQVSLGDCWGDRQRLTEAMLNLADNAVRHTQTSAIITLGCQATKTQISLWVSDTGEGIHPRDQSRIFERFSRLSKHRRSEGSGLGLTIVKAIAEAHGGRVRLTSQVNEGSRFSLILPRREPQKR